MNQDKVNNWLKEQIKKPVLIIIVTGEKKIRMENDLYERPE